MKSIIRSFLINIGALWLTSQILPSITILEGAKGLVIGGIAFMTTNLVLVPLLRVLLLPLNLLTLGVFAWLSNVLALYILVTVLPNFQISAYRFPGIFWEGFIVPPMDLNTFQVVIVASFLIGFIIHFISWLIK